MYLIYNTGSAHIALLLGIVFELVKGPPHGKCRTSLITISCSKEQHNSRIPAGGVSARGHSVSVYMEDATHPYLYQVVHVKNVIQPEGFHISAHPTRRDLKGGVGQCPAGGIREDGAGYAVPV